MRFFFSPLAFDRLHDDIKVFILSPHTGSYSRNSDRTRTDHTV